MIREQLAQQVEDVSLPRFLDAGEAALVVEFGDTVDPAVNDRVLSLDASLGADTHPAIRELVPTYRSLMIHYDPLRVERDVLISIVRDKLALSADQIVRSGLWTIPCCYDAEFGEDVKEVAQAMRLSPEQVVALHVSATYRVHMYGFAPGFTYLGGLPEAIAISRRPTPRSPHEAGAVLIGGGQSAIATFSMPTGWYVIGRTPERLYAPGRNDPFLLQPGESLRFEAIDVATFLELERRAASGDVIARQVAA